jgi:hypothetical protein
VEEPSVNFECVGGAQLEALQLRNHAPLGSYTGYSGSAVERVGIEPGLAGVLQEQHLDRYDHQRATNVLFAVTMRDAIERFIDYFDTQGLVAAIPSAESSRHRPHVARATATAEVLDTHTAVLEQAADWQARGLMAPAEVYMIQVNVARSVVEESVKRELT